MLRCKYHAPALKFVLTEQVPRGFRHTVQALQADASRLYGTAEFAWRQRRHTAKIKKWLSENAINKMHAVQIQRAQLIATTRIADTMEKILEVMNIHVRASLRLLFNLEPAVANFR